MPRPSRFLLLPFLLSLTGILFCCWNLWGSPEALCVTEGCRLFQDFTIGGISLWLIGALSFAVFLLAALTGFAAAGHVIAACGLMLDCVLLCVMIAAAPCFNCLLVGLLLALVFLAFRTARREQREGGRINEFRRPGRSASPLFALWGVLFLLDAGVVAHGMMKPWPLPAGNAAGSARVYFSPSCEACRALVAAAAGEDASVAWYPVAERERDLVVIAEIIRRTAAGESLSSALDAALISSPVWEKPAPALPGLPQRALLQLRLWRNRAHVLEAGSERLPFVEFTGAPAVLLRDVHSQAAPKTSDQALERSSSDTGKQENVPRRAEDSLFGVSGFCTGEEPCEKPGNADRGSLHELMNSAS